MLQNEYLVANFGFDTAKNESRQVLHFLAEKSELNTVLQDRIRQLRSFGEQTTSGSYTWDREDTVVEAERDVPREFWIREAHSHSRRLQFHH